MADLFLFWKEFDVADADRHSVDKMIETIDQALKEVGTNRQGIILAALSEILVRMEKSLPARAGKGEKKKAS